MCCGGASSPDLSWWALKKDIPVGRAQNVPGGEDVDPFPLDCATIGSATSAFVRRWRLGAHGDVDSVSPLARQPHCKDVPRRDPSQTGARRDELQQQCASAFREANAESESREDGRQMSRLATSTKAVSRDHLCSWIAPLE